MISESRREDGDAGSIEKESSRESGREQTRPSFTQTSDRWIQTLTLLKGVSNVVMKDMVVSDDGEVYVVGYFQEELKHKGKAYVSKGRWDIFLAKFDTNSRMLWLQTFGGEGDDVGESVTLGAKGDIFVTGSFQNEVKVGSSTLVSDSKQNAFVARFQPNGQPSWAVEISLLQGNFSKGTSIVANEKGDVFFVGFFAGLISLGDLNRKSSKEGKESNTFVAKLSSEGKPLWMTSFGGGNNEATSITIDKKAGGLFVSGAHSNNLEIGSVKLEQDSPYNTYFAKMDEAGKVMWAKSLKSGTYRAQSAIVVDKSSHLFLAGTFSRSVKVGSVTLQQEGLSSLFLFKLSSNGEVVWGKSIHTDETRQVVQRSSFAVNKDGEVYILTKHKKDLKVDGKKLSPTSETARFSLLKFGDGGKPQWTVNLPHSSAYIGGIGIDKQGFLSVVGNFRGTWKTSHHDVASLEKTSLFVAKLTERSIGKECKVHDDCPIRFHCSQGVCAENKPEECKQEIPSRYCLSKQKLSASCPFINGTLQKEPEVVCSNQTSCSWGACQPLCQTSADCSGNQVCSLGLCREKTRQELSYGYVSGDISIAKKQATEHVLFLGGTIEGDVVFGGKKLSSKGKKDVFFARLNSAGAVEWVTSFGGSDRESLVDFSIDSQGHIWIVGTFYKTTVIGGFSFTSRGSRDLFLAKLSSNGSVLWATSFGSKGLSLEKVSTVKVTKQGQVLLSGTYGDTFEVGQKTIPLKGKRDVYILAFSLDGKFLWLESYESDNNILTVQSFLLDSQDQIYLSGYFGGTLTLGSKKLAVKDKAFNAFVGKFDARGKPLWAESLISSSSGYERASLVTESGDFYMTGYTKGPVTVDGKVFGSEGKGDVFVTRLTSQGKFAWLKVFGSAELDVGSFLYENSGKELIVMGRYSGTMQVGSLKVETKTKDTFLLRLDALGQEKELLSLGFDDALSMKNASILGDRNLLYVFKEKLILQPF